MHDVSRLRQTLFDHAMRSHGVTRAQWRALAQLSRVKRGGMAQTELALHLGLGKVAVGAMVDRLESSGLVERRADRRDKRVNRIHVTPRGRKVLQDMAKVGRRLNLTILEGLSPGELSVADRAMTVMRSNLCKAPAGRA